MRSENTKRLIFFVLAIVLFLPLLQTKFRIIDSGVLGGYVESNPDVHFTFKGWWDGTYQEAKNRYLNDSVGFRPDFVRLNNEIDYFVLNKAHGGNIIRGKRRQMFQSPYIQAYYGKDFISSDSVKADLYKLRKIQDTLEALGKKMIFVIAPSKAQYVPEDLPDGPLENETTHTYYKSYRRVCDSLGIHNIDVNAWFIGRKGRWEYPVFTRQGVHWSTYGSVCVADSMIRYLNIREGMRLPHMVITDVERTDKLRGSDGDLTWIVNLITPPARDTVGYPVLRFTEDSTTRKPKMIFIGDSFVWNWVHAGVNEGISKDWEYWYYFNELYDQQRPAGYSPVITLSNYDWRVSLAKADCIVIVYSETNFQKFADSFIKTAYSHFYAGSR